MVSWGSWGTIPFGFLFYRGRYHYHLSDSQGVYIPTDQS